MNSKEALEELNFQVGNITYYTHDLQRTTYKVKDSGLFEIIEKDLEYKEKLEKAIEICKEKIVDIINILRNNTLNQYNKSVKEKYYFYENYLLTEEEFNLLKEAFCNE